ncbi:OmpA/MotB domain-containing protein [Nitritalea halalkaliphila LW7]|uniref:OmpA/MotB domain-containing protein n=1 Tax=Nitritalea halalkaliphila LW7 TaxID=1189621 RepID=I5BWT2_9BACT|nr:OmpA family protein [Nitritalea halalkaliphila]EIM74034.1 OmpA/MotB domain-containing protein [Nitritalea halalkaliphila LW7]
MKRLFLLLLGFCLLQQEISAQKIDLSFTQRKINQAERLLSNGFYQDAYDAFNDLLEVTMEDRVVLGFAKSAFWTKRFDTADKWFQYLHEKSALDMQDYKYYAELQVRAGLLEEAEQILKKGMDSGIFSPGDQELEQLLATIARTKKAKKQTTEEIARPLAAFEQEQGEVYGLTYADQSFYYVKEYKNQENKSVFELFRRRTFEDAPIKVSTLMDDKLYAGPVTFSKEYVFYSATPDAQKKGLKAALPGSTRLAVYPGIFYRARKADGTFGEELALAVNDVSKYAVLDPFWDEQKGVLYFASDMPGGYGGLDIYYQIYIGDNRWTRPINAGPEVNTFEDDRSPAMVGDYLFFSSRGHTGFGGYDLYKAERIGSNFRKAENLGFGINSNKDEVNFMVDPLRPGAILFSSNRTSSGSELKLFTAQLSPQRKEVLQVALSIDGVKSVRDGRDFTVQVFDFQDKVVLDTVLKQSNGKLQVPINDAATIAGLRVFSTTLHSAEFILQPGVVLAEQNPELRLRSIRFGAADVLYPLKNSEVEQLSPEAKEKLDWLAAELRIHAGLRVELGVHADARKSTRQATLFTNRQAALIQSYLESKNVDQRRISIQSKGNQELKNDCLPGLPCSEEEHQENNRVDIVIRSIS